MPSRRKSPEGAEEDPAAPFGDAPAAVPAPPDKLHATMTELPEGMTLHRVHEGKYDATEFNPGVSGNARFSPIRDEQGNPVPTLYAGSTRDCALMESVFHDVPCVAGLKTFDQGKLAGQVHSQMTLTQPLKVVDLSSVALRKLGLKRRQIIDTEKDQYPNTRTWCQALRRQYLDAQGLTWVSRQDDSARAVVLFGDRVSKGALQSLGPSVSLVDDDETFDAVLELVERMGVDLVDGES